MKLKYLLFFFSISLFSQSKLAVKYYYEEVENGFNIMVDNNEYCEVSVVLRLNHENVTVSSKKQDTFIVPARTVGVRLSALKAIHIGRYGFDFRHREYRGNITKTSYNKNFPYSLPFKKGQSFLISQGYDGDFSHKNIKALDFDMPLGTPVTAIRGGTVVKVEDSFDKHGETADFARFSNYIIISHPDGTFSRYAHLKKESAKVKAGDFVTTGKVLALSGNTGWTTGPHLHLEVYIPKPSENLYIKTKFKVGRGHVSVFLKENQTVNRNY
ncbi:MAG: M23 family metallopeptidase [Flavobacteriaceae bacterium]|nr:M23 family metallopeptidase [Flavobacteriaceae bacterium]